MLPVIPGHPALPEATVPSCRIRRRTGSAGLILAFVLALAGCAGHHPPLESFVAGSRLPGRLELQETPFFPQQEWQCGPAALATLLVASGVDVTPQELAGKVYLPDRHGSLQLELIAASRRYQRLPYVLDPELPALLAELDAGRPVLILQNLGLASYPIWHYAVVIGFDTSRNEIILRSGDRRRFVMTTSRFLHAWELANRWALVTLRPGEFPANPVEQRYVIAVAALESAGQLDTAARFYTTALRRWPDSTLAMFGLGNVYYAQGEQQRAEMQYRRLLAIQPGYAAARNNLAQLLADRGCRSAALAEIEVGLATTQGDSPLRQNLLDTRNLILDSAAPAAAGALPCPVATESGWQ